MDRLRNAALLTRLIEGLCSKGDWCGETHVQKTAFFVQELMGVPLGFRFILYKHGPFSFGLRDELTALRADGLLELEPRTYGAQLIPTKQCVYIQGTLSEDHGEVRKKHRFCCREARRKTGC